MDGDFDVSINHTPNTSLIEQDGALNKNITSILSMLDSPAAATEDENEIQDTQTLSFLKDIVAYVEVRTGTENRSKAICRELMQMGATIVPKFTNEVTHVIFKDGKKSTCDKAIKRGVHLVSVLWVDSCKQNQELVSESLFPGGKPQLKGTPIMVARLKKSKSMQPKDFDEEVASSAERNVKNRKRMATIADRAARFKVIDTPGDDDDTPTHRPMFLVENTCPRSPNDSLPLCHGITIPATPPSMREKLNDLRARKSLGVTEVVADSESDEEGEPIKETPHIAACDGLPLQRRLFGNNGCPEEDPLGSAQSSPLFLSGGSSNNSTAATSPYVNKLLKQNRGRKSNTVSPEIGSPCDKGSSLPPGHGSNWSTSFGDKSLGISSRKRSEKVSPGSESSVYVTPETADNITCDTTADMQNDEDSLVGNKHTKPARAKSIGRKKKLLSTNYDLLHQNSQLIAPVKHSSDEENSDKIGAKKKNDRNKKRRKVTAKKNDKVVGTVRDPSVLFTGKEVTGQSNDKKNAKRKMAHLEDENDGTPKKKAKINTYQKKTTTKKDSKSESDDNEDGYDIEKLITEHDDKADDSFEIDIVSSSRVAKKNRSTSGHGVKFECKDQSSDKKVQKKSILKKGDKSTDLESAESQPLAVDIETPPQSIQKRRKSSLKSSLVSNKSNPSSPAIANNKITSVNSSNRKTLSDTKSDGNIPSTLRASNRRKSVNFKNIPHEPDTIEAKPNDKKPIKEQKGRRKSMVANIAAVSEMDSSSTVKDRAKARRKSIATSQVEEADNETSLDLPKNISKTSKPRRKSAVVNNSNDQSNTGPTKKASRRSSVLTKKVVLNEHEEEDDQVSPELAIQSSKKTSVINRNPVNRRRSVRFSNINNSTFSTQGSTGTNYDDSLTDVTALSSQNVTLTPSARTKQLIPALAKNNHFVHDTLNESDIAAVDPNLHNDSISMDENQDISIETARKTTSVAFDKGSLSTCESMMVAGKNDSTVLANNSTLLNLTRSRKSIDEFSTGPVIKKKLKSRACSLPLPNLPKSSTLANNNKSMTTGKKKNDSLVENSKVHRKTGKNMLKSEVEAAALKSDKRKWKKVDISSEIENNAGPARNIVMTSLHFDEQDMVHSVVKRLGDFSVRETVNKHTTHVVCGEGQRRTLNVLYCIAQGGWLVSLEWVFKSLEAGKWLDETDYEMNEFFPSCKISREEKEVEGGRNYCPNLFSSQGPYYVVDSSKPPKKDLIRLIKLCGGKISPTPRQSDVCIGSVTKAEKLCVSEQWVLDSITEMKTLPCSAYKLNSHPRFEREPSPDY